MITILWDKELTGCGSIRSCMYVAGTYWVRIPTHFTLTQVNSSYIIPI